MESGNAAHPVTLHSKNVNEKSNINAFLMPFMLCYLQTAILRSFPSLILFHCDTDIRTQITHLSARYCVYKQIFSSKLSQVHAARANVQKSVHLRQAA